MLRYEDVVAVAGDPELFTTTVQNVVPKVAFTAGGRRCISIRPSTPRTGAR